MIFLDISYYTFYRYYSIVRWFGFAHKDVEEPEDWSTNELFMERYKATYWTPMIKFIKKYKLSEHQILIARDCHRKDIWRKNLFPDYKANRDYTNFAGKGVFNHTYTEMLPKIIDENNLLYIEHKCAEADDIVAVAFKHFRQEKLEEMFYIIASDADYYQLHDEHTQQIKFHNSKIIEVNPKHKSSIELIVKILMGDKADNIPQCFPKCGPKTALKIANGEKTLESIYKKYPNAETQYELNRKIIDMNEIPQNIVEEILSEIN